MDSASTRDEIDTRGTEAGAAGVCAAGVCAADVFVDGVRFEDRASRVPYPTLDQVAQSVAIQRLQWLRHLPAPRTMAEKRIFQRIRALGWSAPG